MNALEKTFHTTDYYQRNSKQDRKYTSQLPTSIIEVHLCQEDRVELSLDYIPDKDGSLTCAGFARVYLLGSNGRVIDSFQNKDLQYSDTLDAFTHPRRNLTFTHRLPKGKNILKIWTVACGDCHYTLQAKSKHDSIITIQQKNK